MTTTRKELERTRTRTSSSSSSTTTTTVATEPGVHLDQEDLRTIRERYVEVIGPINMVIAGHIERYLKQGMSADCVLYAIDQTGIAPRPSAHYLIAILSRMARQGIMTMADELASIAQRDAERAAKRDRWYNPPQDHPW